MAASDRGNKLSGCPQNHLRLPVGLGPPPSLSPKAAEPSKGACVLGLSNPFCHGFHVESEILDYPCQWAASQLGRGPPRLWQDRMTAQLIINVFIRQASGKTGCSSLSPQEKEFCAKLDLMWNRRMQFCSTATSASGGLCGVHQHTKRFFPTGEHWGCRVKQRNELFVFIKLIYLVYSHLPKMQEFKFRTLSHRLINHRVVWDSHIISSRP